jgi:hypothetical protein
MSAKGRSSDYAILATLSIISVAILSALVIMGWLRQEDEEAVGVRSSHSARDDGTMACYTLFERLGLTLERVESPLLDDVLAGADVMFVIDPVFPMEGEEGRQLFEWLRGGGVIVCTPATDEFLRDVRRGRVGAEDEDYPRTTRRFRRAWDTMEHIASSVPASASRLPLARDVSQVELASSEVLDHDAEYGTEGGGRETLFIDSVGVRVAARTVGRGRVIVLSDGSFLANAWLGRKDNAVLAVNVVSYAISQALGKRVAFDEYHFGFGARPTGWGSLTGLMFRTAPGWAVLSLTAAGVLYLFYRGRRFGTRRAPVRTRRRSKLEFVRSVGATWRAVGANTLAFRLIFQWFRRRGAQRVGLTVSAPSAEIASRLAECTGASPARYGAVLQQCESALTGQKLSMRRISVLLSELAAIESEVFDGHSGRQ